MSLVSHPAALVLVDLQNAYFEVEPLRTERARLTEAANELIGWARAAAVPVVNLRTEHQRDGSTWTLNMVEDQQGFAFAGNEDAQPLAGLRLEDAIDVVKTRDDGFLGTPLGDVVRGMSTLVIAGVSTHTCVAATAAHAYAADLSVVLVHEAIASHRPDLHRPTLEMLSEEYRMPLMDVASLVVGGLPDPRERHRPAGGIQL